MVFICPQEYTHEEYNSYFNYFSFELSNWQKWSLQALVEGNHSLVTAPTGSGKTLPAEFSIKYFHSIGKKLYILLLLKHYQIKNIMSFLVNILIYHLEY